MRRVLGTFAVIPLIVAIGTTALAGVYEGYMDGFNSGASYAGSDGTLKWAASWIEEGEKDGPLTGAVQAGADGYCANGSCLQIAGVKEPMDHVGALRVADTSTFDSAELCFDLKRRLDGEPGGQVYVQISRDGGESWPAALLIKPLDTSDSSAVKYAVDISDWVSESTAVRFVLYTPGAEVVDGAVFIDNVWIKGESVASTTTSTTSTTVGETTTTTSPSTTTTSKAATTTSTTGRPGETTTTTHPITTTSPDRSPSSTTTTTISSTTSTTEAFVVADNNTPGGPPPPPESDGIRETQTGIQADFDGALFRGVEGETVSISTVDHQVDYRMAVEVIKSSWVWLVVLAFVVAWSIVSGLERRRGVAGG